MIATPRGRRSRGWKQAVAFENLDPLEVLRQRAGHRQPADTGSNDDRSSTQKTAHFISSDCPSAGSVAVRERLPQSVTNVRSLEADVLKQVVVELTQLLTRTDALAPPPNGGDDLPDRRQQLDISLATTRHLSRERPASQRPQRRVLLRGAIKGADYCSSDVPPGDALRGSSPRRSSEDSQNAPCRSSCVIAASP